MFPDIETMMLELLTDLVGTDHVGTVAPAGLAEHLPYIRVNRYGGPDDGVTDFAVLDVDVFAARRTDAWSLCEQARTLLHVTPHHTAGGIVDSVRVRSGPQRLPWDASDMSRFGMSVEATSRRQTV